MAVIVKPLPCGIDVYTKAEADARFVAKTGGTKVLGEGDSFSAKRAATNSGSSWLSLQAAGDGVTSTSSVFGMGGNMSTRVIASDGSASFDVLDHSDFVNGGVYGIPVMKVQRGDISIAGITPDPPTYSLLYDAPYAVAWKNPSNGTSYTHPAFAVGQGLDSGHRDAQHDAAWSQEHPTFAVDLADGSILTNPRTGSSPSYTWNENVALGRVYSFSGSFTKNTSTNSGTIVKIPAPGVWMFVAQVVFGTGTTTGARSYHMHVVSCNSSGTQVRNLGSSYHYASAGNYGVERVLCYERFGTAADTLHNAGSTATHVKVTATTSVAVSSSSTYSWNLWMAKIS